ncbi:uncharacterized protein K444DRAFT_231127 [Hyaloscypha bicolor E]|uniref:Uncharacterized protein n=1 Tax=Hyaloscypha bicolor E TaxID=1095630 RepID=A0A2J6SKW6_9HELO|nr:uncharacterized protein K444DRAFT_231127 [Hyaloscypha bicolor E]PMD51397.1 hypothetical protein K444DRAFT_231127 [Hyaloscypha bicolor E]
MPIKKTPNAVLLQFSFPKTANRSATFTCSGNSPASRSSIFSRSAASIPSSSHIFMASPCRPQAASHLGDSTRKKRVESVKRKASRAWSANGMRQDAEEAMETLP